MIRPERPSAENRRWRAFAPRSTAKSVLIAFVVLALLTLVAVVRPSSAATTTWSVASSPGIGNLNGVSCDSTPRCVAVGYVVTAQGTRRTLAQTSSGTTWTVMPTTNRGNRNNVLAGV